MKLRKRSAALALAAALLVQPVLSTPAWAQHGESAGNQFAAGFGCFLISPVYGAFKMALAFSGIIVGTLTWAFTGGDTQTAAKVWDPTLKGTYVISPEHLRGERRIIFIGEAPRSTARR